MSGSRTHLPRSVSAGRSRVVPSRRRQPQLAGIQWKRFLNGLGLSALGSFVLVGLLFLPERLDTLLLVSHAISNLIAGIGKLLLALAQFVGLLLLVAVALGSLLLLVAGLVRMVQALWPDQRVRSAHPSGAETGSGPRPAARSSGRIVEGRRR